MSGYQSVPSRVRTLSIQLANSIPQVPVHEYEYPNDWKLSRPNLAPAPPPLPPRQMPNLVKGTMTPLSILMQHKGQLPLRLKVALGVYGSQSSTTFNEGDVCTVHFTKKAPYVLLVEASRSGNNTFKFPVASTFHFGLLYDPNNNAAEAKLGFDFKCVQEIISLKTMPKLVKVLKGWRGSEISSVVEQNDLLFIKGVHTKANVTYLKCIQANTGLEKLIKHDTSLPLSTKPSGLLLPLMEILKHIQPPFKAVVSSPKKIDHMLTTGLTNLSVVTIQEFASEKSLIVTFSERDGIFEMPSHYNIELSAVEVSELEKERMRSQTLSLFTSFNSTCIDQSILAQYFSQQFHSTDVIQEQILNAVDKEYMKKSQIITIPPNLKQLLPNSICAQDTLTPLLSSESRLQSVEQTTQMLLSETKVVKERLIHFGTIVQTIDDLAEVKKIANTAFDQVPEIFKELKLLIDRVKLVEDKMATISNDLRHVQETQRKHGEQLKFGVSQDKPAGHLEKPVTHHEKPAVQPVKPKVQLNQAAKPSGSQYCNMILTTSEESRQKLNKEFLRSLTVKQVSQLLENLSMPMYTQYFVKEDVNGCILAECNERILEKELYVQSIVHRKKLMDIITGKHSAADLLNPACE